MCYLSYSQIGILSGPFAIPEEIEARETRIREYFLREIDRLITEKHICHVRNLAIAANVSNYVSIRAHKIIMICMLFFNFLD